MGLFRETRIYRGENCLIQVKFLECVSKFDMMQIRIWPTPCFEILLGPIYLPRQNLPKRQQYPRKYVTLAVLPLPHQEKTKKHLSVIGSGATIVLNGITLPVLALKGKATLANYKCQYCSWKLANII